MLLPEKQLLVVSAKRGCWQPTCTADASIVPQPRCHARCQLQSGARVTQRVSGIRSQTHVPGKATVGSRAPPLVTLSSCL